MARTRFSGRACKRDATKKIKNIFTKPKPEPKPVKKVKKKVAKVTATRVNAPAQAIRPIVATTPAAASTTSSTTAPNNTIVVVPGIDSIHQPRIFGEYQMHLNLTDRATNADKFIKMQVCTDKTGNKFWFFNSWGRNGTSGQHQIKGPFSTSNEAIKLMEKKFKTKTGKNWANRNDTSSGSSSNKKHYDIVKRLQDAGAGMSMVKGSIAISLMWDHSGPQKRNDLDLWVTCPSGEKIGYYHKESKCGGKLDVDRMQDALQPVENTVWKSKCPKGKYKIQVNNFSLNHTQNMEFYVSIVKDGGNRTMNKYSMPGIRGHWMDIETIEKK